MGSCYFATCEPDLRFSVLSTIPSMDDMLWIVQDWDERRTICVRAPYQNDDKDFIFESLAEFIDDLPPDAVEVSISGDGALLSSSSAATDDRSRVPFYPSLTDYPSGVATVRRRDLVEQDRLGLMVDLTTYKTSLGDAKQVVFKYFLTVGNRVPFWHESNCVMRMPPHPNIVPFEALVIETVEGDDKVVGFLTRYIPGGTLHENKDRVFKLKYLEQLIDAVDFLNLRLGIVHGDICPWNLLIDAEADALQLFDFNLGAKLGWEGDEEENFAYEPDRNDVKFVIFTLYEIITRAYEDSFRSEFYPHELDEAKLLKKRTWPKHADTQLDHPVTAYRRVLDEWLDRRKTTAREMRHFTQAAEPLDWPSVPGGPTFNKRGILNDWAGEGLAALVSAGREFVPWQRPSTSALLRPKAQAQRLLATGEIVDGPVA